MANVFIDLNTQIDLRANPAGSTKIGGLVGTVISDKLFGVNFLSSFERGDAAQGGFNFDDIILAAGNVSREGGIINLAGITTPISNIRFPGGALTEEFYAQSNSVLSLDSTVNSSGRTGISARSFVDLCKSLGAGMTQVMPTWRYLDTGGLTQADRAEMTAYVHDLLKKALDSGVNVTAFEIGNEYWSKVKVDSVANVTMTASQYGKIAAEQAVLIKSVIADFQKTYQTEIQKMPDWGVPKVLVQMGAPSGDYANEGYFKAQNDSQRIISQFQTVEQRSAVDGFVVHRYEANIDVIGDPWVKAKPYHFDALVQMISGIGWKPLDAMTLNVSEWNVWQTSEQTGLRSFATVVALMGEMVALGVDSAEFWSAGARAKFPMARVEGGAYSPTAQFSGLTFTGEAFRMMNESLQGKQSLMLYQKTGGSLLGLDGNKFDMSGGDNMRTYVEAFSDGKEVVLFLSNLSGESDTLTLDLAGMIGNKAYHAWGSLVESTSSNPLDNSAAALISNFDVKLSGGVFSNFQLGAYETLRLTITIGDYGAEIFGYNGHDDLDGSTFADVIDGRLGNDTLSGLAGNDTIFGGAGADSIFGGDGVDIIYGGTGDDSIGGSEGNDFIYGGDGNDWAMFFGSQSIQVDLSQSAAQNTGYGFDVLESIESVWTGNGNDTILGSQLDNQVRGGAGHDFIEGFGGNDRLEGNQGNDLIYGGAGNDTITGSPGGDRLFGGAGRDEFVFSRGHGRDVIGDFEDGVDRIRFSGAPTTFAELSLAASADGISITYGVGDVITVTKIGIGQVNAEDFLFG